MDRVKKLLVVLAIAMVVVTASFIVLPAFYGNRAAYSSMDQSEVNALNSSIPSSVQVYTQNSTIVVDGNAVIPVEMGPMNAPSMYSFEIYGIINPHLIIMKNSQVTFVGINVDTDLSHNFVITEQAPPYGPMIGMGGMMGGSSMTTMPFLPPVNHGSFAYYNTTYTFSTAGTFWYICEYPQHAQNGMYGQITVQ